MRNFKKIVSIVLAVMMVMAMSVTAFAAETSTATYNVTIYKTGTTTPSMANDAVNGTATVTTLSDGSVQIDIPIVPILNTTVMSVFTADGYLNSVTVDGGTGTITNIVTKNDNPYQYASATLTIVMSSIPEGGIISITDSMIYLFDVGTTNEYWYDHVSPSFDIVLS